MADNTKPTFENPVERRWYEAGRTKGEPEPDLYACFTGFQREMEEHSEALSDLVDSDNAIDFMPALYSFVTDLIREAAGEDAQLDGHTWEEMPG